VTVGIGVNVPLGASVAVGVGDGVTSRNSAGTKLRSTGVDEGNGAGGVMVAVGPAAPNGWAVGGAMTRSNSTVAAIRRLQAMS